MKAKEIFYIALVVGYIVAMVVFAAGCDVSPDVCIKRCESFCGGPPKTVRLSAGRYVSCGCTNDRQYDGGCE